MLSSDGAAFTVEESCGLFSRSRSYDLSHSKTPTRTLVHRSLLRARLYNNSRGIGILEAMIRKNAESGPENFRVLRRESGRSHLAMLLRPKAGGDVVWDTAGTERGLGCLLPGYFRDKEEFYRA